ncbi:MAG: glycosyltransferase [Planctomycetota bacterium]
MPPNEGPIEVDRDQVVLRCHRGIVGATGYARPSEFADAGAMPDANRTNSLFIAMPQGLGVNGVVVWGIRLANALADRGWRVAVAAHGEPAGESRIDHGMDPRVKLIDLGHLPPIDTPGAPLHPVVTAYRDALDGLGWSVQSPTIVLPTLEANCFAAVAALASTHADRMRVIGWHHSDNAFNTALLSTYQPMLTAMVGVSRLITDDLASALPWRANDVHHITCGVNVVPSLPQRQSGPIRLLYAGRLEHEQKRIGVLLNLAKMLHNRDVDHEIRFVGGGPAEAEVADAIADLPSATQLQPASQAEMHDHLAWADALLLSSHYEGLSLSMLEAMAAGVVPIVTHVRSGATEAIVDGEQGLLIDPQGDDQHVAERFADMIARLDDSALRSMATKAHRRALNRYSIQTHAKVCETLFEQSVATDPRWWPLERPCTFTSSSAANNSGSVPPDAAERAAKAIANIDGPIAIYGAGRHTKAIAEVLAKVNVVCVIDDDPKNHGTTLWGWPVVGLERCPSGAFVLVSSFIHRQEMAERCRDQQLQAIVLYEEC